MGPLKILHSPIYFLSFCSFYFWFSSKQKIPSQSLVTRYVRFTRYIYVDLIIKLFNMSLALILFAIKGEFQYFLIIMGSLKVTARKLVHIRCHTIHIVCCPGFFGKFTAFDSGSQPIYIFIKICH